MTVKDRFITLDGTLDWQYQGNSARTAVEHLSVVKGITNLIILNTTVLPAEAERAAWSVAGVTEVENHLVIGMTELAAY